MGAVSPRGNGPRCAKGDKVIGQLIKWCVTMLVIVVVGTVIGWGILIIIAAVPLWAGVAVLMVVLIALFKFAVWVIGEADYV